MAELKRKRPRSSTVTADKAHLAAKQRAYRVLYPDRERATKQRAYLKHREKIIAKSREYAVKNPEKTKACVVAWRAKNKEWNAERDRAYREKHKDRYEEVRARYYAANKERLLAYYSAYTKANPDRRRAKFNNRRARLMEAGGRHTAAEIREIGDCQNWRCVYCRTDVREKNHLDHILPLKLGGGNGKDNLQLLCKTCNLRKGAKHPSAFRMAEVAHG